MSLDKRPALLDEEQIEADRLQAEFDNAQAEREQQLAPLKAALRAEVMRAGLHDELINEYGDRLLRKIIAALDVARKEKG